MNTLLENLKEKDEPTYNHSIKVGVLVKLLALSIGKNVDEADKMKEAGEMHDIGKIQISDEVLKGTGVLSQEQRVEMELHCIYGAVINKNFNQMWCDAARYHHLNYMGGGYPESKLCKTAIPEVARITAICDVFDALTSKRSYKESMSIDQVKEIMDNQYKEGKYDPKMYRTFWEVCVPQIVLIKKASAI